MLLLTGFARGKFERLILVVLFLLYLSFAAAGQEFLSFQWDSLLLEAGFLAIFLGRNRIVPWLFRWLVFRLYFLSGAVKLLSADPTWRNLSAVGFHWHTQPLPTPLAWYADKLPTAIQHFMTGATLGIEVVIPFLIFFPRRIRMFGAWCLIGMQVLIFLTGNYTFFNLLTIALTLFLFDDRALARFVPAPVTERLLEVRNVTARARVAACVAVVVLVLSLSHLIETFNGRLPSALNTVVRYTAPLQIVNTYGLFAVMTTQRIEIILEGSADGETWQPYEFKYKPGDVNRAPGWVAPYQPRLDWQMWFAALSNYQTNPWFVNLSSATPAGFARRRGIAWHEPVSRSTAPLHSGNRLRVHLHRLGNPPPHRRLVEAGTAWFVLASGGPAVSGITMKSTLDQRPAKSLVTCTEPERS